MKQIIYDEDCAVIFYEPELSLLTQAWKREINSDEYRRVFITSYITVKEHKIRRFISDISKEGFIDPKDRIWLENEIIPKAFQAGLKFSAIVLDQKRYKNYYSKKIMDTSENVGMQFGLFNDYQKARDWIISQNIDE